MIKNHIIENLDQIVLDIGQQALTETTCALHQCSNSDNPGMFVSFFGVNDSTPPQQAVSIQLATIVYTGFIEHLKCVVRQAEISEPIVLF